MRKAKYTKQQIRDAKREIIAAAEPRTKPMRKLWLLKSVPLVPLFLAFGLSIFYKNEDSSTTVFYEFLDETNHSAIREHYRAEGVIEHIGTVGPYHAKVFVSRRNSGFGAGSGYVLKIGDALTARVALQDSVFVMRDVDLDGKIYTAGGFRTWPDVPSMIVNADVARIPDERAQSMLEGLALHVRSVEGLHDVADAIAAGGREGRSHVFRVLAWAVSVAFVGVVLMVLIGRVVMRRIERPVIEHYLEQGGME